jgi:alkylation response protein AidB-like acyl-CoA dehydrogenase
LRVAARGPRVAKHDRGRRRLGVPVEALRPGNGAEFVLTNSHPARDLPAETARWSTITQIYEGTNQIQRMVMARLLLKG